MSESQSPEESGVALRYATALFELAEEMNQLESAEKDLAQFEEVLSSSSDLLRLIRSPVFSVDEKSRAMKAILEKIGVSGLVSNFVLLVAKNARLFVLPGIIRAFQSLAANKRGEVKVDVQIAVPLSESNEKALNDVLYRCIGKNAKIRPTVDSNLLGGIVVKVGSKMIDSSLRTKLNSLKFAMKEVR